MSRGSKAQTVGYRYALGAHLAVCHGPVDLVREIRVDDRLAWSVTLGAPAAETSAPAVPAHMATIMMSGFGSGGETSTITFAGQRFGFAVGRSYRLVYAEDGTIVTRAVTIQSIAWDGSIPQTAWTVSPGGVTFGPAMTEVHSVAAPEPDNAGSTGGDIFINQPELFGGDTREGGIVGPVDVLMGAPDQAANAYLAARMGGPVPGYRGVFSLVLRQVYMGLNPYLKPWAVRLTRILKAENGAAQWYPETAQIHTAARIADAAIYIALDASGTMSGAAMAAQLAALAEVIREIAAATDEDLPNDIRVVLYATSVVAATEMRDMGAADHAALIDWIEAQPTATSGGTDLGVAVASAPAFFAGAGDKRRVLLLLAGGDPSPETSTDMAVATLAGLSGVDRFAFRLGAGDTTPLARIDNTPVDGVPIVALPDAGALVTSLRAAFGAGPDMNGAHIIRECLTNGEWGLGYSGPEIGTSFVAAADRLFAEGFGLSLIWQSDSSIEDFISLVLDHIEAVLFIDLRTGLWELVLIRDDYEIGDLPVFDERCVVDWGRLGRREPGDLINSVTLSYTSAVDERTATVTVSDPARVQALGQVISRKLEFPGIRHETLAVRVAERELRALSVPLMAGEIVVNRAGSSLRPGSVIRLQSVKRGLDLVMRVSEVGHGDGRSNGIRLKLAEDVFALGETALVGGPAPARPRTLVAKPGPVSPRLVDEAPYWLMVRELGHVDVDATLDEDPTLGLLVATGARASATAPAAQVWADAGTGFVQIGSSILAPGAVLSAGVTDDPEAVTLTVADWTGIGDVPVGTLASVGGELVRVDGITATSLTVGRGCLDTVPRAHAAGTPVIFLIDTVSVAEGEFAASEAVAVRLLTETPKGVLAFARAPEDAVLFDRRAIRPLPPGNLKGNGAFVPAADALVTGDLALTWSHRDRLAQTSAVIDSYTAGSIGPEPGVAYEVEVSWIDPATGAAILPAAAVLDAGTADALVLTAGDVPVGDAPAGVHEIAVAVWSVRDGLRCREARRLRLLRPGVDGWGESWGVYWGG